MGSASAPQVRKRSGTVIAFNREKITQAIKRCFINSCNRLDNDATTELANKITKRVEKITKKITGPIDVETIQDLVEQSLMAEGEHAAAREYILYREAHRKLRSDTPIDPKTIAAFTEGVKHFTGVNRHLQIVQAFDKFARFRDDLGRREVWPETVDRVINWFQHEIHTERGMHVPPEKWEWLRHGLLTQMSAPSMRAVQLAGPALTRCNSGVYNCSYLVMDSPESLAEDLYLLMQGCGVGFSVENEIAADKWPRVKRQKGGAPLNHTIPDTTEGWCDALKIGVNTWLNGGDVVFDDSLLRREGVPLKTKGGTSSGPGPLRDLLKFARAKILSCQGACLSSLDIHDITCFAHRIVQMGGVRRASGISLSDLQDMLMRGCKDGNFFAVNPQRNQANNSAVYNSKPTMEQFLAEWTALVVGKSGERGIFNRGSLAKQMPVRRLTGLSKSELARTGTNPCGEIILPDRSFCNLSIGVLRPNDSMEVVQEKVSMAAAWGTLQSAMTRFNYLRDDWRKNVEKERLLGVDLLGHLDHRVLGPRNTDSAGRAAVLKQLRAHAISENQKWAQMLGMNSSAAVTCNKPSGDSSVFYDTSAGFKPHHGRWYLRRLRFKPNNPVAQLLKEAGVPFHVDYDRSGLLVFEFPCQAPVDNPILLGEQSAVEQLENWKTYKLNWTEHNPSTTVFVRDSEWLAVGAWVYDNWDIVGGLSFFPFDDSVYPLAPYETITQTEYDQRAAAFPEIEWAKLTRYEVRDMTELKQHLACAGGACEI